MSSENGSLKRRVRDRMSETGERYTTARQHLLAREASSGPMPTSPQVPHRDPRVDAYLAKLSPEHRELLEGLRERVHELGPRPAR